MLIKAYSVNKIGQKFLLPKIITDICIRKTSLSSQTDTKRAVREASLIPIVLCLNATKIGSPFHLSYKCANVLRHNYRFRGCYRDKRHLKSSIRVLT